MSEEFERNHPRNPRGEWVEKAKPETSGVRLSRIQDGCAEADIMQAAAPADTTRNLQGWWDNAFLSGEYTTTGTVAKMPDDWTPNMTEGRSISGHRRTHRMKYTVADTTVRMPSKTAIRSYMNQQNLTVLDVPIGVSDSEGERQQFVRVYKGANGLFDVRTLGGGADNMIVGESVAAVLENRTRLYETPHDLIARRQSREALAGVHISSNVNNSSFITAMHFNPDDQTITVAMGDRAYIYEGSRDTYDRVMASSERGAAYNRLIKAKTKSFKKLVRCQKCGRFASEPHQCPTPLQTRNDAVSYMQRMEALGRSLRLRGDGKYPPLHAWSRPSRGDNTGWTRSIVGTQIAPIATRFNPDFTLDFDGLHGAHAHKVGAANPDQGRDRDLIEMAQIPGVELLGRVSAPMCEREDVTFTGVRVHGTNAGLVGAWKKTLDTNKRAAIWRQITARLGLSRPVRSVRMDSPQSLLIELDV